MTLDDRLNKIGSKLEDAAFLAGSGIGNEIGFYVFDYPPEEEPKVRDSVDMIKKHFSVANKPRIIEINLLDVMLDILKKRGVYDKVLDNETKWSMDVLKTKLSPLVRKDAVAARIAELANDDYDIVFITGVGSAYPLIRTHEVLNNLHDKLDTKPVVVFYPGKFTMQELLLFGVLDSNYYRAFRLID